MGGERRERIEGRWEKVTAARGGAEAGEGARNDRDGEGKEDSVVNREGEDEEVDKAEVDSRPRVESLAAV